MQSTMKTSTLILLTLLMASIGSFASDSYLPSFPAISQHFHATNTLTKLTITTYLFSYGASQLIYGPLSDRYGRRKIIFWGYGIFALGSLLCAMAPSIHWLLVGRFMQGVGIGAPGTLYRAILRDSFSGSQLAKISSYGSTAATLTVPLAPVIGGYLEVAFSWRANFVVMFIYTLFTCLILWRGLPETNRYLNPKATNIQHILKNFKTLLSHRIFISYVALVTLAFSGIIAYVVSSPFLFQNIIGLTPVQYGWVAVFTVPSLSVGAIINSRRVEKYGIAAMIRFGSYCMIAAGSIMLFIGLLGIINTVVIIAPMMLFSFGSGFIFSNSFAAAFEPFHEMAGMAAALFGSLQILGTAAVSALVALVHEHNQIPLSIIILITALLLFAIQRYLISREI
jgi:DHA1 family 2-module integral membrane pump EmrD-like MFS transporter